MHLKATKTVFFLYVQIKIINEDNCLQILIQFIDSLYLFRTIIKRFSTRYRLYISLKNEKCHHYLVEKF